MPQYLSPGVYVEEAATGSRPIEGVGTAVAAFVGFATEGPFHTPTLVTNWTQYTNTFGGFGEGCYLAAAVYAYFNNGGGSAYIVRVGGAGSGDDDSGTPARAELTTGGEDAQPLYRVESRLSGAYGNDIRVEVADAQNGQPEDSFRIVVHGPDGTTETFDGLTTQPKNRQNVVTVLNQRSTLVKLQEIKNANAGQLARPHTGSLNLTGGAAAEPAPTEVAPSEYVGDPSDRTGFSGLETIETVTMVSVPDLMSAYQRGIIDMDGVKAVQLAMLAHCESMGDRVAIIDPPPGLNAQQMYDWRVNTAGYDSKYGAVYWPWVNVMDPATGRSTPTPPSGHVAGIWARNDATRGVHKAPANEVVNGALDVETRITRGEHDLLNPVGVNCIRAFAGRGIRVWGARTLSSDPAWRYVNVRRLFNFLEASILGGTQWVVFEPNDRELWSRMRLTIASFLYRVWLDGALFGSTPQEAYYVKCDDETNPSEVIEAGQVICEVGVAAVKPAEFVVFRLAQLPSGTAALAE